MVTGLVLLVIGIVGIVGLYMLYRRAIDIRENLPDPSEIPWLADNETDTPMATPISDFLSGLPLVNASDTVQVDLHIQTVAGRTETVSIRVNQDTAKRFHDKGIAPFIETLRGWEGRTDVFCMRCLGPMFEDVTASFLFDLVFADAMGDGFDEQVSIMQDMWEIERLDSLDSDPEIVSDQTMDALFAEMTDESAELILDTDGPPTDTTEKVTQ